jgi:ubiquinone biosynthesis protein
MLLAPRYLPRLAATVGLFTKYGLRDFAQRQGLLEIDPEPSGNGRLHEKEDDDGVEERAAAFRRRLVELGPAYIKLGQVLSTRPDLIPEPYIRELERLQDDVAPVPFADVERTVEEELGGRLSKLFDEFDHEPLGSASLGQVHAATLRDGRAVVVKVQRPDIRSLLADDVEYFNELARFMTQHTRAGRRVDMIGVIQQLERALHDELDYRIEARNGAELRLSLAEFPRVLIPRVVDAYTTGRVLTTERIRGVKVNDIPPIARTEHDFRPLADDIAKAYLKQITICGHFHADPHPGNLFVVLPGHENPLTPAELHANDRRATPRPAATLLTRLEQRAQASAPAPEPDGPRLALIDFGMTARLSAAMRDGVVRLLMDLADNRGDDAAETLIEMGSAVDEFNREAYMRELATLVARNYSLSVGEVQAGEVLYEVITISYQHGLRLPAELTLLAKALFNLDAVTRALDPTYSPIKAIREYTTQIANERAQRELSPRRLFQAASETTSLMTVLPHRLDVITQRMAANDFGFRVDAPQLTLLMKGLQRIANRIFSGLVLCGLLIASAMLHPYRPTIATSGFIVAGVLALYMVVTIILSDRKRDG